MHKLRKYVCTFLLSLAVLGTITGCSDFEAITSDPVVADWDNCIEVPFDASTYSVNIGDTFVLDDEPICVTGALLDPEDDNRLILTLNYLGTDFNDDYNVYFDINGERISCNQYVCLNNRIRVSASLASTPTALDTCKAIIELDLLSTTSVEIPIDTGTLS